MKDIALIGKARSGKDSVAKVLTEEFGYRRLAFADELKKAALEIDPWVSESDWYEGEYLRHIINVYGWDAAKTKWPDVRRFLQNLGHTMRQIDPDIWIDPVLDQVDISRGLYDEITDPVPTVITDCRYLNEAASLRAEGFTLVRVVRPDTGGDEHVSETELDDYQTDYTISNEGDLGFLAERVRWVVAAGER